MVHIKAICAGDRIALEYALGPGAKRVSASIPNDADSLRWLLVEASGNPNALPLAWPDSRWQPKESP